MLGLGLAITDAQPLGGSNDPPADHIILEDGSDLLLEDGVSLLLLE